MKFRLLAPAFLALVLFIAGCPSLQPVTFASTDAVDDYTVPSDCDSCACLMCQRPDILGSDIEEAPTGVSGEYLAKSGGGLSGSRCWFQVCGAKLKQQMKEDSSLYQVPFKIGIGQDTSLHPDYAYYGTFDALKEATDDPLMGLSSWQSREAARYCPMTDKWCPFAAPGTKDRWQNIFRSYGFDAFFRLG